jgi:hypothetical protein
VQNAPPKIFPTAGRVFLESMQGKRDPITEADFSPDELNQLRQLIKATENKGNVQYSDYVNERNRRLREEFLPTVHLPPSILAITNPLGNLAGTLGRFTYVRDADGNLRAIDDYDFNRSNTTSTSYNPLAILRRYAGEKMPPGTGRSVNINLGK